MHSVSGQRIGLVSRRDLIGSRRSVDEPAHAPALAPSFLMSGRADCHCCVCMEARDRLARAIAQDSLATTLNGRSAVRPGSSHARQRYSSHTQRRHRSVTRERARFHSLAPFDRLRFTRAVGARALAVDILESTCRRGHR